MIWWAVQVARMKEITYICITRKVHNKPAWEENVEYVGVDVRVRPNVEIRNGSVGHEIWTGL